MSLQKDHAASGPEHLALSIRSTVSGRKAFLKGDGFGVWLYLSAVDTSELVAGCLVYSVEPPVEQLSTSHGKGGAPILQQRYASEAALQPALPANAHHLAFSVDGHAVAVFVRGEPWAFSTGEDRSSYSKSLSRGHLYGQPWNEQLFHALFPFKDDA